MRGVVEILLGDRLLLRERRIAIYVELDAALIGFRYRNLRFRQSQLRARLFQLALRLCESSLRLVQRRLEWTGVDLKEQLAFADESALGIVLLDEVTGDLSFDVGVDQSVESADPLAVNRNVFLDYFRVTSTVRGGGGLATEVLCEQPYAVRSAVTIRQACIALRNCSAHRHTYLFPPAWFGDLLRRHPTARMPAKGNLVVLKLRACAPGSGFIFLWRGRKGELALGGDLARIGDGRVPSPITNQYPPNKDQYVYTGNRPISLVNNPFAAVKVPTRRDWR